MKYLSFIRSSEKYRDAQPPAALQEAMGTLIEKFTKEGALVDTGGLAPSRDGFRVRVSGRKLTTIDGPFAGTKELIAGFWLWHVKTMAEALEWARRCPEPMPGEEGVLEIRPVFEADDFGQELTPELRAQEEGLRARIEQQRS